VNEPAHQSNYERVYRALESANRPLTNRELVAFLLLSSGQVTDALAGLCHRKLVQKNGWNWTVIIPRNPPIFLAKPKRKPVNSAKPPIPAKPVQPRSPTDLKLMPGIDQNDLNWMVYYRRAGEERKRRLERMRERT